MRRILITQHKDGWTFEREGAVVVCNSPLLAAMQALQYGESLRGRVVGFVIRLADSEPLPHFVTLHTCVFSGTAVPA